MSDVSDPPTRIVRRLESICSALPDAYSEEAWIGLRWRIRQRTFAHTFGVGADRSTELRAVAGSDPVTVLTFRADGEELFALQHSGRPFYHPGWGRDVVGMVLTADTDWAEVTELVTESYCLLAPKRLAARVRARSGTDG